MRNKIYNSRQKFWSEISSIRYGGKRKKKWLNLRNEKVIETLRSKWMKVCGWGLSMEVGGHVSMRDIRDVRNLFDRLSKIIWNKLNNGSVFCFY